MSIELFFYPTPNAQRALIALEEAQLPYLLRFVDLHQGKQNEASFQRINAAGAVPVLIDPQGPGNRRLVLTQSSAICFYIADKSRTLVPLDLGQRVKMLEWMMLAASDIAGTNTAINQLRRSAPEPSELNASFFEQRFTNYLAACDARLNGRDYLADEFSLADVCLYPFVLARSKLLGARQTFPHLHRWKDRLEARPAVAKAMSITEAY